MKDLRFRHIQEVSNKDVLIQASTEKSGIDGENVIEVRVVGNDNVPKGYRQATPAKFDDGDLLDLALAVYSSLSFGDLSAVKQVVDSHIEQNIALSEAVE